MQSVHGFDFRVGLQIFLVRFDDVNDFIEDAAPKNLLSSLAELDRIFEYQRLTIALQSLKKKLIEKAILVMIRFRKKSTYFSRSKVVSL